MALNITSIAGAQGAAAIKEFSPQQAPGGVPEKTVADMVQLSADARRRLDELVQGQTIAEAYLQHIIETAMQAPEAGTDQETDDEQAAFKFKAALDSVSLDIGWLIEALGLWPAEAEKLKAVISAQATVAYARSAPPVPEIIVRARTDNSTAAVFVHGLSFDMGRHGVDNVSLERLAVTAVTPGFAEQIKDPATPKVIVMGDDDGAQTAGSADPFKDPHSVASRLASTPSEELRGMLIVREKAATADLRRVRVDALMPL